MNRLSYPQYKLSPYITVTIAFGLFIAVYGLYEERLGTAIIALAIIPIIGGSWYFGIRGGLLTSIFSVVAIIVLEITGRHSHKELLTAPHVVGDFMLIFIAVIVGRLTAVSHERKEALSDLEKLERDRREYINFLESLHGITREVLKARDVQSTLKGLVERIARLFEADDAFFAFWDEENKITTPMMAYGSMSEIYPTLHFEPGARTLTAAVMKFGKTLAIPDLKSSSYISSKVASIFPSRSMLGIPLIIQGNKVASFYLGYNQLRQFGKTKITYAEIIAQQIALVLSKLQLLEDAQKQVKQLKVLHEVALISTQVETINQLIECVTEIIGKSLFPDNFGILLMNEEQDILDPHSSYRFGAAMGKFPTAIPLGQGIIGKVAQTGQSIRLGNIHDIQNYLDAGQGTLSELCVPIKLKDRVLGVINAESTRPNAFSLDDELLLGTLAGQLATATEQLRTAEAERKWLDQLAHSRDLIYALAQITTHIEKAFNIDEIIKNLVMELHKISLTCIMAVYSKEKDLFTVTYTSMEPEFVEVLEKDLGQPLINYSFARDKLKAGDFLHPTVLSNPVDEIEMLFARISRQGVLKILQEIGMEPQTEPLRLPLLFEENLLGVLWVWGKSLTKADLPIMSIFAKQIGISLERARLFQDVQSLALTDPLTGLSNRRSLFELGRVEFSRAVRMNREFCCMMLDLDYFKQINDTYGHPVGDEVLREFADRCRCAVREMDLIGRYGGEELIILLPETERDTALQIAERLRASTTAMPIQVLDKEIAITVSIGVAAKDENTTDLEILIARADQAMYIAKHKGRNRVAISK